MKDDTRTYYGINTGFGALCHVRISKDDIEALQENLVLSHACGVGEEVPDAIVRIMLLLKIRNFLAHFLNVNLFIAFWVIL
jgi:histidine ammonia-lyase